MGLSPQTVETVQGLWIAIGVLVLSNFGVLLKLGLDHYKDKSREARDDKKAKESQRLEVEERLIRSLDEMNKTMREIDNDLQRAFTAVKLVAGKKWPSISKVIQEDHPRRNQ